MRNLYGALALAVLVSAPAVASDKADVKAVVHKWLDGFNMGDMKASSATCADSAIIIDDFPPHVWQGPGTCAAWGKDYEAFAAKAGISGGSVTFGKIRHFDVGADYAYVVTPATLSYTKDGKPVSTAAVVTMALHKAAAGWQITGWAWANQ